MFSINTPFKGYGDKKFLAKLCQKVSSNSNSFFNKHLKCISMILIHFSDSKLILLAYGWLRLFYWYGFGNIVLLGLLSIPKIVIVGIMVEWFSILVLHYLIHINGHRFPITLLSMVLDLKGRKIYVSG